MGEGCASGPYSGDGSLSCKGLSLEHAVELRVGTLVVLRATLHAWLAGNVDAGGVVGRRGVRDRFGASSEGSVDLHGDLRYCGSSSWRETHKGVLVFVSDM